MPGNRISYRCEQCGAMLFVAIDLSGRIEKPCRRCKHFNVVTADLNQSTVTEFIVHIADILNGMEQRWRQYAGRRAVERGVIGVGLRFEVFKRDDFRCQYCGISAKDGAILHADHIMPQSRGGPTTLQNLVTACIDCNLGKSDRLLDTLPLH